MSIIKKKNELGYIKEDNCKLFKGLEENASFGILQPQNYIPIYNSFFTLSPSNFNTIVLNHTWRLNAITAQEGSNLFQCSLKADDHKKETRKVFLKFSPLLDPVKYLLGKYDITDPTLFQLPSFDPTVKCHPKTQDYNNAAYVDGFFTYLTSKLLHEYGFLHGMDFFGSFLALKTDFRINIIDDIDYLNESSFFRKQDKLLYELEYNDTDDINSDTRNYKKKLNFTDQTAEIEIADITDLSVAEHTETVMEYDLVNIDITVDKTTELKTRSSHDSSCSSRSSNTNDENTLEDAEEEDDEDAEEEDDEEEDGSSSSFSCTSSEDEDSLIAKIKTFPVHVIALEQCENTLDHLIATGDDMPNELWDSIVLQILFSLITFQNAFGLTHNDLHTNNVMYSETDIKYLYYKLNHVYYKVPTYGKLFKIIDYGRAIYKFRGQLLCSDSYHAEGDAATQYNCEPYFNDKKPRLDPNMGFDLCRLGCALYDFLIDEPKTKITQIILDWVKDDKGRNILYKKNGDERYPDFKLYKMIARTANKHVPAQVLNNPYFDKFIITKKDIKKNTSVMDLDAIPCFM